MKMEMQEDNCTIFVLLLLLFRHEEQVYCTISLTTLNLLFLFLNLQSVPHKVNFIRKKKLKRYLRFV